MSLHEVGLDLFFAVSVLSLFFVIAKPLGKEFEAVALTWVRAFKRIRAESRAPYLESAQPPKEITRIRSKRELDSVSQ